MSEPLLILVVWPDECKDFYRSEEELGAALDEWIAEGGELRDVQIWVQVNVMEDES